MTASSSAISSYSMNQPIIVMKFGGTSVGSGSRMKQVSKIIMDASTTCRPVVVVSAMSGQSKKEGTTQRLLAAIEEILIPESMEYLKIVDELVSFHLKAATEAIPSDSKHLGPLIDDIKAECNKLRSFMAAAEIVDEISPKTKDVIVSMGEKLSARILAATLESMGIPALFINLDKLVDRSFDTKTIDQNFYSYLATRLGTIVGPKAEKHVCVLTGFFGPCPGSLLKTVGRGYTDLTAALACAGLVGKELQVWKEVDGIFTADPRKVKTARKMATITPEEAAELTYYGSEVIHPFTMEQVVRANIPIRIKNTFNPTGDGTLIIPDDLTAPPKSPTCRRPTAITVKDNVIVLNVHSNRRTNSHGFLAQTFSILDNFGIVVDLIATSEVHVSMVLGPNIEESKLKRAIEDIMKLGTITLLRDQAIISLVGKEMRSMVGISAKLFTTLCHKNINIEMISQGASEINISCVINQAFSEIALQAIHDELIIGISIN